MQKLDFVIPIINPYNNRYISFLPSDVTEIFISGNVKAKRREFIECDRRSPNSHIGQIYK